MRYETYSFLWQPRPGSTDKTTPDMLGYFENKGYFLQLKKNGTGSELAIGPDRKLWSTFAMRRDNTPHRLWTPSEHTIRPFRDLPGKGWYYFVTELLHSKVKNIRDISYINDILVRDGEYLVGTTFAERQDMLTALFPDAVPSIDGHHLVIDEHTWLARNYKPGADYAKIFNGLTRPEDEGVVLKKPTATLALCIRENSNSSWQIKCRKPHKNFGF